MVRCLHRAVVARGGRSVEMLFRKAVEARLTQTPKSGAEGPDTHKYRSRRDLTNGGTQCIGFSRVRSRMSSADMRGLASTY